MKILYHHRTQSKDGQAVHIRELIHALRERGCEVIVVEPTAATRNEFGSESSSVATLRRLMPKAMYELLELGYSIVAFFRLRRAYLEHRPDVLYERHNLFLLAGAWMKRAYGIPYLLEVNAPLYEERAKHGGLALARLARWTERHVWRTADHVLPVTGVLGDIIASNDVDASRITVVPNGINQSDFSGQPSTEEAKRALGLDNRVVLGFTGFVRDWHGIDAVIDFIAASSHQTLQLLVVGDGPVRAELEAQARRLGLGERVRFTGVLPRHEIPRYVSAFDVALQPASTSYASPLKLFEYMALGRAIVAPAQPNILEVLRHEDNALLFAAGDADSFKQQLSRLVGDADLRQRLGDGARRSLIRDGYTWNRNAERVIDIGSALCAATAPGSQRGTP